MTSESNSVTVPPQRGYALAWLSLLIAAAGTGGSLYLSLGLGLKACPLCFYQRTFIMATGVVLAASLWADRERPGRACWLVLPLVWGGLGVALFHEYLVLTGVLECPIALFGVGSAPAQSLAIFALLAATSTLGACGGENRASVLALIVVGGLLAWACVASSPPLPAAPAAPYDPVEQPLDMCRPAYQGT